jgi:hypothetical protein
MMQIASTILMNIDPHCYFLSQELGLLVEVAKTNHVLLCHKQILNVK